MTQEGKMTDNIFVVKADLFSQKRKIWRAEVRRILDGIGGKIMTLGYTLIAIKQATKYFQSDDQMAEIFRKLCVGFATRHPEAIKDVPRLLKINKIIGNERLSSVILEGFATLAQGSEASLRFFECLVESGLLSDDGAVILMKQITLDGLPSHQRTVRDQVLRLLVRGNPDQNARACRIIQLTGVALRHSKAILRFCPYSKYGLEVKVQKIDDALTFYVGVPDETAVVAQEIFDTTKQILVAGKQQLDSWVNQWNLSNEANVQSFIARQQQKWAEIEGLCQVALHPEESISLARFPALSASGFKKIVLRRRCEYPELDVIFKIDLFDYRLETLHLLNMFPFPADGLSRFGEQLPLVLWGLVVGVYHSLVVRGDPCFGDSPREHKSCTRSFKSRRAHLRNPATNGYRCASSATVEASKARARLDGNYHLFENSKKHPGAIYVAPSKPIALGYGWSTSLELSTAAADRLLG